MRGLEKNCMKRDRHTYIQRTSRLYDRIGPVGRFDEKIKTAKEPNISFVYFADYTTASDRGHLSLLRVAFAVVFVTNAVLVIGSECTFVGQYYGCRSDAIG